MKNESIVKVLKNRGIKTRVNEFQIKQQYKELYELKTTIDRVCVGEISTWKDRILIESSTDEKFLKLAKNIFANVEKMDSQELDKCFEKVINNAQPFVDLYLNTTDIFKKYEYFLRAERYFGIIEQIDEMSTISETSYKVLLEKYGYDKILEIEKANSSLLTKLYEKKSELEYSEDVKKYLVLKKWQDKQNIYNKKTFENLMNIEEVEDKVYGIVCSYVESNMTFRRKFKLFKLLQKGYIDINDLSKLYILGVLDDLRPFIGGKAYGLAILNCYCNIPKTYVISYKQNGNIAELYNILSNSSTYAVRSSADCEDNDKYSFAGVFDSYLNVSLEQVPKNIENVKASVHNDRADFYIKSNNLPKPHMNVIVQEYIDPDFAGVWMADSLNSGVYEQVEGCGESLVSGKNKTQIHNFDENDKISSILVQLQKTIGFKCDFEFCIKDKRLIMLQCRPVTTLIKKKIKVQDGIGVSSGRIKGEICFLESPQQIAKFKENSILLTYATDPEWVPIMAKAKGIITLNGGYLCHTAIISRELGKPCIVRVDPDLFNKLKKSSIVSMDASTGVIKILGDKSGDEQLD